MPMTPDHKRELLRQFIVDKNPGDGIVMIEQRGIVIGGYRHRDI